MHHDQRQTKKKDQIINRCTTPAFAELFHPSIRSQESFAENDRACVDVRMRYGTISTVHDDINKLCRPTVAIHSCKPREGWIEVGPEEFTSSFFVDVSIHQAH